MESLVTPNNQATFASIAPAMYGWSRLRGHNAVPATSGKQGLSSLTGIDTDADILNSPPRH